MRKKTVPIVSGNVKYLGLTIPEWCIFLSPMGLYVIIVPTDFQWIVMLVHLVVIIIFIVFVSKIEENIIMVLIQNLQLPSVISGYFKRPAPVKGFSDAKAHALGGRVVESPEGDSDDEPDGGAGPEPKGGNG